jgi:hypothetical protein
VWAGTAGGANVSGDGGLSWRKYVADGSSTTLLGNWVISIEEQRLGNESIIWMANWKSENNLERFGVTYTSDGGASFRQTLQGERIYDFAFVGTTVFAAGDNGLFVSDDGGDFWVSIRDFRGSSQSGSLVPRDESIFSVVADTEVIWVGTGSGLLKSIDNGASWTLDRVNVPLKPESPNERVPSVETFAYPNPFSPAGDGFVRIRYELGSSSAVKIRIFDFGMNPVRTLNQDSPAGISELRWDGMSDDGVRVANGPYFYEVRSGANGFRGKILVIE